MAPIIVVLPTYTYVQYIMSSYLVDYLITNEVIFKYKAMKVPQIN